MSVYQMPNVPAHTSSITIKTSVGLKSNPWLLVFVIIFVKKLSKTKRPAGWVGISYLKG